MVTSPTDVNATTPELSFSLKAQSPVKVLDLDAQEEAAQVPAGELIVSARDGEIGQRGPWRREPEANVILPTGRVFDVFDVPHASGLAALSQMDSAGFTSGPVAAEGDRVLFYVATRGNPEDEDEWWPCSLDCGPTIDHSSDLRWHCRDSYVIAPPSTLPGGVSVSWLRPPDGAPARLSVSCRLPVCEHGPA